MLRGTLTALLLGSLTLGLVGCAPALPTFSPFDTAQKDDSETASLTEEAETTIPLLTLDGRRYSFSGNASAVEAEDDRLTLRQGGVYRLCGTLSEGTLCVDVGLGEVVRLILDGVSLSSSHAPCLSVISAASVILETTADSVNLFSSPAEAVIDARSDLLLCGEGSLSLSGAKTAVFSTHTVSVEGGSLLVTASEYGILASHRIQVLQGALSVSASRIGLRTEEGEWGAGGILLSGGRCAVLATEVALSARFCMELRGGVGSFRAPLLYRTEEKEGTLLVTGGDFPSPPS